MENNFIKIDKLKKSEESGFTLIELLIVIVVLGILMSMAVPALSGVKNKAETAVAKADLHNIMQSLEMYYLDQKKYPDDSSFTAENLADLSIKNDLNTYSYQTNTDQNGYLIYYKAADQKYYYISTKESALLGPVTDEPSLTTPDNS